MRRFLLLRTELFMWQGFYLLNYRVHDVYINSTRILFQGGARATRAFLRYYCQKNPFYQRRQSALLSKGFFDGLRSRKTEGSPNALKPGVLNGRLATCGIKSSLTDKSTSNLSSVDSSNSSHRNSDISDISLVNMPF